MKYIHILLLFWGTLGVACNSVLLPSNFFVGHSLDQVSNIEEYSHSIIYFLLQNENSNGSDEVEDAIDLDTKEENSRYLDSFPKYFFANYGVLNSSVGSILIAQFSKFHSVKRYLLYHNFKIDC